MAAPRANRILLPLPEFTLPTRAASWDEVTWHRIVTALRGEPGKAASYARLLEMLGVTGDAQGARSVRKAVSSLILGAVPGAPRVERVARGQYRLVE